MMKTNAIRATMLTAIVIAAANCGGKKEEAAAETEKPAIVLGQQDVGSVRLARINSGAMLTGSLQPGMVASVKAQVPGTISNIGADRGVRVSAGQTLATIRAEGIRGQAEGARAGVASAQANLAVAEQRLESARTLRGAGALSEIDFKAAAAGYEAARAQLAAARANSAGANEAAGNAVVRAPFNGVVGSRAIELGEAVVPGDELFTVVRSDFLELSGQVPIEVAALIRPGQRVVFNLDAYPGRDFAGEVSRIEPMADPNTRQVGVYLRMRNPGNIVGGQFATGRIETSSNAESPAVPEGAIRGAGADTHVLVIQNGKAAKRVVTLGGRDAATGLIEIRSGVQVGETVIVTPSSLITDGARVQVGK
jgi:membrane fusion protein, multidrug efflux system